MTFKKPSQRTHIQEYARNSAQSAATHFNTRSKKHTISARTHAPLFFWAALALASGFYVFSIPHITQPYHQQPVAENESFPFPENAGKSFPPAHRDLAHHDLNIDNIDPTITSSIAKSTLSERPLQKRPQQNGQLLGAVIGIHKDMKILSDNYQTLYHKNPELFDQLSLRIQFDTSAQEKTTRLIAGPFASENAVQQFCQQLMGAFNTPCTKGKYHGYKIILSHKESNS